MPPSILFLRSNPVSPDPRVDREAGALGKAGYQVTIIAWDRSASLPEWEVRPHYRVMRIPIPSPYGEVLRGISPLIKWQAQLTRHLSSLLFRCDIVHACDFDTLIPPLLLRRSRGWKVVYDAFDSYADMHVGVPRAVREGVRLLDRWAARRADALILPARSRLAYFGGARLPRFEVIGNSPDERVVERCLQQSCIPSSLRIAYVGILAKERGLTELLKVVSRHPEWRLEIAGFGRDAAEIRRLASSLPNVRFHGPVSYPQAVEIYASAHVMAALYDPTVPNHRFSSPNKLHEAALLGKPLIVAEGTGVDREVSALGLGFVIPYGNPAALEMTLESIARWSERKRRAFCRHAREIYRHRFAWSIMEERLLRLYKDLLGHPAAV